MRDGKLAPGGGIPKVGSPAESKSQLWDWMIGLWMRCRKEKPASRPQGRPFGVAGLVMHHPSVDLRDVPVDHFPQEPLRHPADGDGAGLCVSAPEHQSSVLPPVHPEFPLSGHLVFDAVSVLAGNGNTQPVKGQRHLSGGVGFHRERTAVDRDYPRYGGGGEQPFPYIGGQAVQHEME